MLLAHTGSCSICRNIRSFAPRRHSNLLKVIRGEWVDTERGGVMAILHELRIKTSLYTLFTDGQRGWRNLSEEQKSDTSGNSYFDARGLQGDYLCPE